MADASKDNAPAKSQAVLEGSEIDAEELYRVLDSVNDVSKNMEVTSEDRQAKELQGETWKTWL